MRRCARHQTGTSRLEEVRFACRSLPLRRADVHAEQVSTCRGAVTRLEPRDEVPGHCVGALLCHRVRDGRAIFEAQHHQRAGDRAAGAAEPPHPAAEGRGHAQCRVHVQPEIGRKRASTDWEQLKPSLKREAAIRVATIVSSPHESMDVKMMIDAKASLYEGQLTRVSDVSHAMISCGSARCAAMNTRECSKTELARYDRSG